MESTEEPRAPADLKACMNFKWTDDLTLQFILYRHERRHLFTKKRNTSRHGWQHILRDMGLSSYVTPYQAQKKWNNLWSKYKVAKRAQTEGGEVHALEDSNGAWPFFTILDAIATGKTVAITNQSVPTIQTSNQGSTSASPSVNGPANINSNDSVPVIHVSDEPPSKIAKMDERNVRSGNWDVEPEDHKQHVVDLLQANLHQLGEIKQCIETQGQAIVSMLSQLINVISNGTKSSISNNNGSSRIDEAITATIREIGIPQENV